MPAKPAISLNPLHRMIMWILSLQANQYTSNWSHLGGFVCGLFPSFLFLPNFKDRR